MPMKKKLHRHYTGVWQRAMYNIPTISHIALSRLTMSTPCWSICDAQGGHDMHSNMSLFHSTVVPYLQMMCSFCSTVALQ